MRAAPAKNRSSSTRGGISSAMVRPTGLPVLRHSAATISCARAAVASAIRSSARLRSAGVVSRHTSNAPAAARSAASTSAGPETGARAYSSPVLGSTTALVWPAAAATYSPLTKLFKTADATDPTLADNRTVHK